MKTEAKKIAKYADVMTLEQRRIFTKLFPLPDVPTGEAIREQFHCSRATAEVVATAIADYRMTPTERKAKEAAAPKPRRHFEPVTAPGSVHAAFSDAALDQLD